MRDEASLRSCLMFCQRFLTDNCMHLLRYCPDCCRCGGIPFRNVTAVADAVRVFLDKVAPDALVYINECAGPFAFCTKANGTLAGLECIDCSEGPKKGDQCWAKKIPASIDLISLDMYCSVKDSKMTACQTNGVFDPAAEVRWARPFYETQIKPRLLSHQRLFVIPGTFADWNMTRSAPIEQQQAGIVRKLNAYWAWAQSDALIVGLNCWHWSTIPGLYAKSPGIIPFYYGVDHMPKVVARLTEIGITIRNETRTKSIVDPHPSLKSDDLTRSTSEAPGQVVSMTKADTVRSEKKQKTEMLPVLWKSDVFKTVRQERTVPRDLMERTLMSFVNATQPSNFNLRVAVAGFAANLTWSFPPKGYPRQISRDGFMQHMQSGYDGTLAWSAEIRAMHAVGNILVVHIEDNYVMKSGGMCNWPNVYWRAEFDPTSQLITSWGDYIPADDQDCFGQANASAIEVIARDHWRSLSLKDTTQTMQLFSPLASAQYRNATTSGTVHSLHCPAGNLSCIAGFYQQLADGYELLSALPADFNINADRVSFALDIEGYPHHHRGVPADGRLALITRGVVFWQIVPLVPADGRTTFQIIDEEVVVEQLQPAPGSASVKSDDDTTEVVHKMNEKMATVNLIRAANELMLELYPDKLKVPAVAVIRGESGQPSQPSLKSDDEDENDADDPSSPAAVVVRVVGHSVSVVAGREKATSAPPNAVLLPTIAAAVAAVKALPHEQRCGAVVTIAGGVYAGPQNALRLTEADSGCVGNPVIYRAAPDDSEPVVLTGGLPLPPSSFKRSGPVTPGGLAIWEVDLAALGVTKLGASSGNFHTGWSCANGNRTELYFGGKAMTLARHPNRETGTGTWQYLRQGATLDASAGKLATSFVAGTDDTNGDTPIAADAPWLKGLGDSAWVHGFFSWDWADSFAPVKAVNTNATGTAAVVELGSAPAYGLKPGSRYMFLNSKSLLDAPGEYFIDGKAAKLFFIPPTGADPSKPPTSGATGAFLSKEQHAHTINGTSHVTVKGLRLEHAMSSALWVDGVTGVTIDNCTLANSGERDLHVRCTCLHLSDLQIHT